MEGKNVKHKRRM